MVGWSGRDAMDAQENEPRVVETKEEELVIQRTGLRRLSSWNSSPPPALASFESSFDAPVDHSASLPRQTSSFSSLSAPASLSSETVEPALDQDSFDAVVLGPVSFGVTEIDLSHLIESQEWLGDKWTKVLCQWLKEEQGYMLQSLDASSNMIGNQGAAAIAEMLVHNRRLQSLGLASNLIGDEGLNWLSESLIMNSTLRRLHLEDNRWGSAGLSSLGKALRVNQGLVELNLCASSIGDQGALELSEALCLNTTLAKLDLGVNLIGDIGVTYFAIALKKNRSLESLNLARNRITHVGSSELANALVHNPSLRTLILEGNACGGEGALALARALQVNTSLQWLNVCENGVSSEGLIALRSIVQASSLRRDVLLSRNTTCQSVLSDDQDVDLSTDESQCEDSDMEQ